MSKTTIRQVLHRIEEVLSGLGAVPTALTAVSARQTGRWVYRADLAGGAAWYLKVFGEPDPYHREARALATIAPGIGPKVIVAVDSENVLVTECIDGVVAARDRSVDADSLLTDCLAPFRVLMNTSIDGPVDPIPVPVDDRYGRHFRLLAAVSGRDESELRAWTIAPQPLLPCHGDLTPNNVIVTADGTRLIDFEFFGISQPLHDATSLCLSPSLDLPISSRTTALAQYVQAVADADGRLLTLATVCGAAAMWAARFAERLHAHRSDIDAGLAWQEPLRIAGQTMTALIGSQHFSWSPVHGRTRRTP